MKYAPLLALVALCAACQNSGSLIGLGLREPTAVAVFQGYTTKNTNTQDPAAALHPYVAVASSGKDELALIDAVDDEAVLAPVLVRPLALPTADPQPALLAAGSLGDSTDAARKADLLVVLGTGSTRLQLVQTWLVDLGDGKGLRADNRVLPDQDVELGGPALAIVAAPVPVADGNGGWTAAAGRVRVIAALTGERLAVVEYRRTADGGIERAADAAVVQDLTLGGLRFQPISLALSSADLAHLYVATEDPIPTSSGVVMGVAELDMTGTTGAWTWRGLDARAPTRLVAAARLAERRPTSVQDGPGDALNPGAFEQNPDGSPHEVDRVYAVLSAGGCGPDRAIGCGLAVIDPVAGTLRADPSGAMPFMAPIELPAEPLGLVVGVRPAVKASRAAYGFPYFLISPGSGARLTTGVMAIPSGDGRTYFLDMARWAIPNDVSILNSSSTRTAVSSVDAGFATDQRLGFWYVSTADNLPHIAALYTFINKAVTVTPGYTPTESFHVVYEGGIPGLSIRVGETFPSGDGLGLALQVTEPDGAGGTRVTQVVRVYDPTVGIHEGDVVGLDTSGLPGCKDVVEASIAALLPPSAGRPGGSLRLTQAPCTVDSTGATDCSIQTEYTACLPALLNGGSGRRLALSVSAGGGTADAPEVIVTGDALGYLGRAKIASDINGPSYSLTYKPEDPGAPGTFLTELELAPLCPLVPWPYPDTLTSDPAPIACDATCRARCEALVLARKARRIYNLSDACPASISPGVLTECQQAFPAAQASFPLADGPALAFRVGLLRPTGDASNPIVRGTATSLTTRSGISYANRARPLVSEGAMGRPFPGVSFDRSSYPGKADESYRFFIPYVDGYVLDFSPAEFAGLAKAVR